MRGARFWTMPMVDLEGPLHEVWDKTRKVIGEGVKITPDKTPALAELVITVRKQSRAAAKALKNVYFRKRPYVQLGEPSAVPSWEEHSRTSSSFASAHANLGWCLALTLAEVAPEAQDEVLRIGFNYGYDFGVRPVVVINKNNI